MVNIMTTIKCMQESKREMSNKEEMSLNAPFRLLAVWKT